MENIRQEIFWWFVGMALLLCMAQPATGNSPLDLSWRSGEHLPIKQVSALPPDTADKEA